MTQEEQKIFDALVMVSGGNPNCSNCGGLLVLDEEEEESTDVSDDHDDKDNRTIYLIEKTYQLNCQCFKYLSLVKLTIERYAERGGRHE